MHSTSYLPLNSPHRERVHKIAEKLANIQIGVERERYLKFEASLQNLESLEENFQQSTTDFDSKLNGIRDNLLKVQKLLEKERIENDQLQEDQSRTINMIGQKFTQAIEQESFTRKDGESNLIRAFEEHTTNIKNRISEEISQRDQEVNIITSNLNYDIPKIAEAIDTEIKEREIQDQEIMKILTSEIFNINDSTLKERVTREEQFSLALDTLKDVVNRVKVESDNERRTRLFNHANLNFNQREDVESQYLTVLDSMVTKLAIIAQF